MSLVKQKLKKYRYLHSARNARLSIQIETLVLARSLCRFVDSLIATRFSQTATTFGDEVSTVLALKGCGLHRIARLKSNKAHAVVSSSKGANEAEGRYVA